MSPILGTPGGVLCSSPPAKSSSVPIKSGRPLSKSVPCQDVAGEGRHSFARRVSETGSKLSFGGGRTISISSTPSASCSKPPVAPSAPRAVHVGFAAPESSGVCLSPGRRETKSSLLSRALLDTPTLGNNELFGCAAPVQSFQGLVVVSEKVTDVDMQPLVQLQVLHPVFRNSTVAAAYAVAARAHTGQVRKSGDTVLSHCTATALILAELGLPPDVVAAGLLHDVLCDTSMQPWQLSQALPDSVVSLVTKVHQLNQLSQTYRDNTHTLEAEAMLDMLTGMEDVTALLIKLADRLHNMRTIGSLARCKQVRMASETLDVFAVLANRLGTWSIKAELEDLCFKILNPEEYQLVADAIAARAAAEHSSSALAAGVNDIITSLQAAGLQVVDVSGRVKNVYGVWKKVQKNLRTIARGIGLTVSSCSSSDDDQEPLSPVSPATAVAAPSGISSSDGTRALAAALAQVYDIQALRVVVPHKHDCYVAQRVVEQLWAPMPGRTKDYIRHRKANGYQSLHLTVHDASGQPLEVQIRTPKMHYIAEYGFAAHWKYKEKLGRQDLWLDRLVQWKRWIASVKLGLHDHKVRPSGSPGSGGDAAVAGLAAKLGLEAALAGGTSSQGLAAGGVAAPFRSISAGDAVAAELQAMEDQQLAAAEAAVAAAGRTEMSSSPADAKFAARFRMQPISEAEIDAHGASIMISGPRGVSIAQLPARCTVAQLLSSRDFAGQLSRANSGGLTSALSQLQVGLGLPSVSSRGCRVAVNGVVVLPSMADHVVLRSGDQVQLLDDPLLPLGLPGTGSDVGGMQMVDQRAAGARLPGVMADAGKSLGLFVSGQLEFMEVALQQKLRVASRVPVRSPALVS